MNLLENIEENIKNKSKICLAADLDNLKDIFNLIEKVGHKICILKIHYDIISDFFDDLNYTIKKLLDYKNRFGFLIWEDSKFADIGYVIERKINNHISKWADLISVHPICGIKSISNINNVGVILIGELSCEGHLIDNNYQKKVIEISEKCSNVIGIVCQHKMTHNLLNITPGISLSNKNDNLGQKYNSPKDKEFSDIYVIGRYIYESDNPMERIEEINSY